MLKEKRYVCDKYQGNGLEIPEAVCMTRAEWNLSEEGLSVMEVESM